MKIKILLLIHLPEWAFNESCTNLSVLFHLQELYPWKRSLPNFSLLPIQFCDVYNLLPECTWDRTSGMRKSVQPSRCCMHFGDAVMSLRKLGALQIGFHSVCILSESACLPEVTGGQRGIARNKTCIINTSTPNKITLLLDDSSRLVVELS